MDFKIIWSDKAVSDLREICDYIASDDPDAALRVGEGILNHVRILASFPYIGPKYPRGAEGSLREIVYYNYRIFYDVSESSTSVEIVHVRHGARQEPQFE